MKIWTTLTIDSTNGSLITLHWSEADANESALTWCETAWNEWADEDEHGPCPDKWQDIYAALENGVAHGDFGECYVEQHDFSYFPGLASTFDAMTALAGLIGRGDVPVGSVAAATISDAIEEIGAALAMGDPTILDRLTTEARDRASAQAWHFPAAPLTLDIAQEAFRAAPCVETATAYLAMAHEYRAAEMIEATSLDAATEEVSGFIVA